MELHNSLQYFDLGTTRDNFTINLLEGIIIDGLTASPRAPHLGCLSLRKGDHEG